MSGRITELFNNNVFTDAEMKARLPKKVYNEVKACKLDKGSARHRCTGSKRLGN